MRAVDNIISERRLLEQIDYSLIVNLRYAFQDDENLFMVLDLMLGGDLRFHLERVGSRGTSTLLCCRVSTCSQLHAQATNCSSVGSIDRDDLSNFYMNTN
jgi:serine/threonine protein kinase